MPTMNVYARTEAELYGSPITQQQPEKSFDALLQELFAMKPLTQENADLLARASGIKQELIDTLAGARSAQVEQLEEKHDAAIIAVREAKRGFSVITQQVFEARKEYTRLQGVAENAGKRLGDVKYEFSQLSTALMTKAEKVAWSEKIATAQAKAEQAMVDESAAQTHYNNLVLQEREATIAHNQAVSVATGISGQIDRLNK